MQRTIAIFSILLCLATTAVLVDTWAGAPAPNRSAASVVDSIEGLDLDRSSDELESIMSAEEEHFRTAWNENEAAAVADARGAK